MKVLYAIQTTGSGHISRAKEFIPLLERRFQFDVILSGPPVQLDLGHPVKKHYRGLSLYTYKNGGINWIKTLFKNNLWQLFRDIVKLRVQDYDLVITDFEPISAWASLFKGVLCFGMSNQISLWQKGVTKPKKKFQRNTNYLKWLAPAKKEYGLYYHKFNNRIFSPIIRSQVRTLRTSNDGGFVVYLPGYQETLLLEMIKKLPLFEWHVFTPKRNTKYVVGNVHLHPIDEKIFLKHFAAAKGIITNAGFSTTTEALFLGKPLLAIPLKGQIEQKYNAAALQKMGVVVLKLFSPKKLEEIRHWVEHPKSIHIPFENDLVNLADRITLDFIKSQTDPKLLIDSQ